TPATACRREFQTQCRIILFIHLDTFNFFQLFNTALHLHGLSRLITKTFDKLFRILYLLLLILISTELLLATFLSQNDKLVILHLIIINLPASNLNRAGSHIIKKSPVMTDKNDSIGTGSQKILQPLNTLDIKMVSGLIQQKHVRTTEQQLRKFNAHAP